MNVKINKGSVTIDLVLPTKRSERKVKKTIKAYIGTVRSVWLNLTKDELIQLLEDVRSDGLHEGSSNGYC